MRESKRYKLAAKGWTVRIRLNRSIVVSRTPCVLTETDGIDRLDLWQTDVAGSARDRLFNRRTVS